MSVIIRKDAFYDKEWVYDEEAEEGQYIETKIDLDLGLFRYWRSNVEVCEVTLSELMDLILKDDLITFLELLTNSNIEPYLSELEEDKDIHEQPRLSYIELRKYYETIDLRDYGGHFEINDYVYCDGRVDGEDTYYGISYTSWRNLKHLPVRISKEAVLCLDIRDKEAEEGLSEYVSETYTVDISMGEFFTALFDELCFFRGPEQREAYLNLLKKLRNGQKPLQTS